MTAIAMVVTLYQTLGTVHAEGMNLRGVGLAIGVGIALVGLGLTFVILGIARADQVDPVGAAIGSAGLIIAIWALRHGRHDAASTTVNIDHSSGVNSGSGDQTNVFNSTEPAPAAPNAEPLADQVDDAATTAFAAIADSGRPAPGTLNEDDIIVIPGVTDSPRDVARDSACTCPRSAVGVRTQYCPVHDARPDLGGLPFDSGPDRSSP